MGSLWLDAPEDPDEALERVRWINPELQRVEEKISIHGVRLKLQEVANGDDYQSFKKLVRSRLVRLQQPNVRRRLLEGNDFSFSAASMQPTRVCAVKGKQCGLQTCERARSHRNLFVGEMSPVPSEEGESWSRERDPMTSPEDSEGGPRQREWRRSLSAGGLAHETSKPPSVHCPLIVPYKQQREILTEEMVIAHALNAPKEVYNAEDQSAVNQQEAAPPLPLPGSIVGRGNLGGTQSQNQTALDVLPCDPEDAPAMFAAPNASALTSEILHTRVLGWSDSASIASYNNRRTIDLLNESQMSAGVGEEGFIAGQPLPMSHDGPTPESSRTESQEMLRPSIVEQAVTVAIYVPPYYSGPDGKCRYNLRVDRESTVQRLIDGLRDILAELVERGEQDLDLYLRCPWQLYPAIQSYSDVLGVDARRGEGRRIRCPDPARPALPPASRLLDAGTLHFAVLLLDELVADSYVEGGNGHRNTDLSRTPRDHMEIIEEYRSS